MTSKGVVEMTETRLKNELSEDKEELNKLKESLGEQEAISREAHTVYITTLHSAQKLTGDNYKGRCTKLIITALVPVSNHRWRVAVATRFFEMQLSFFIMYETIYSSPNKYQFV